MPELPDVETLIASLKKMACARRSATSLLAIDAFSVSSLQLRSSAAFKARSLSPPGVTASICWRALIAAVGVALHFGMTGAAKLGLQQTLMALVLQERFRWIL
jgi:hypothetical protein